MTRPPEPATNLNITPTATMVLHSTFIDAVMRQSPEVARAILHYGGLALDTFVTNLATGVMRVRPTVDDESQPAVALEVWDGELYSTMAVIRGELLGLDVEELGRAWSTRLDEELRGITEA